MPGPRASVLIVRNHKGEVLLLLRAAFLRHFANTYSFPGGKAEGDEDELATLLREVKEETGREFTEEDMVFACEEHAELGDGQVQVVSVYMTDVRDRWVPTLSTEHVGYIWIRPRWVLAVDDMTLAGPMTRRLLERLAYPS